MYLQNREKSRTAEAFSNGISTLNLNSDRIGHFILNDLIEHYTEQQNYRISIERFSTHCIYRVHQKMYTVLRVITLFTVKVLKMLRAHIKA